MIQGNEYDINVIDLGKSQDTLQQQNEYLYRVSKLYNRHKTTKLSIDETLKEFSQISPNYDKYKQDISNEESFNYSNVLYDNCSQKEKEHFILDELQMLECLVLNSVYDSVGTVFNFSSIYNLMTNSGYKDVPKGQRKLIYSTTTNKRPVGDIAYGTWNGFQIIDLDIKDTMLSNSLKDKIFYELCKYHWFLGVYKSASGKGLHIWTKIAPLTLDVKSRKVEFLCNFRHKYSYVYIILLKYASTFGYTKDDIVRFLDMAMMKPQQGSFIAYDPTAMMSTNFKNLRLDVNFESSLDNGIETIDWIMHPDLKLIFKKLDWFANENPSEDNATNNIDIEVEKDQDISKSRGKKHYKHTQRWQLANTLTNIFGEEKALDILVKITKDTPYRELASDVRTAAIHNKPISIWAVEELNKQHGFSIKIKNENIYKEQLDQVKEEVNRFESGDDSIDPVKILNKSGKIIDMHLNSNQYLSDLKDDIISNLGNMTLLEAGAGYGKTEMIKSFKAKTLLILPFTSTIKAKVESSETTKDWLYFYGNKRPTLEDLTSNQSMTMTIDKFSRLNVMELNLANFEYIVIDESHLLFISSYRDVMSPTIQRLANCTSKVILMTGTPIGEKLFFPNITHIRVRKDDKRQKKFEVNYSIHELEQFYNICYSMAEDIAHGHKVLFPTNKGNLYFEEICGLVQFLLDNKITIYGRRVKKKVRSFYYKKSNFGDKSMDEININKTIGDNDIVCCTNYLSVGVDICDRYTFSIYFDKLYIPQDIEQFANRLRNNDLFIKLWLPLKDNDDSPINYHNTSAFNMSFDKDTLIYVRDILKACNDIIERNADENKYSPLLANMNGMMNFIKYDEITKKYYIDETNYKLHVFEEKYIEYSTQLEVLLSGIKFYGYEISTKTDTKEFNKSGEEWLKNFKKKCRNIKHSFDTDNTFDLLDHIDDNNIDIYKDYINGSCDIFRSPEFAEDRKKNNLYVKDIETIDRNMRIILSLYKIYDIDTIKEIFKFCINVKSNAINYAQLRRICHFVKIEQERQNKRLDFPILKYIKQTRSYVEEHPIMTKTDIEQWNANYAAMYANSIPDVVVTDFKFLKDIYDMLQELWKVIITTKKMGKNKDNAIQYAVSPFELLWTEKNELENLWGDEQTKKFFIEELVNNAKSKDPDFVNVTGDNIEDDSSSNFIDEIDESEIEAPLKHTSKITEDDILPFIDKIMHPSYDYNEYSTQDGSNDRFIKRQENTNRIINTVFNIDLLDDTEDNEQHDQLTLFD